VLELTGGRGTAAVLECVGHLSAYEMALGTVRAGGVISRVGVPQYDQAPAGFDLFGRNLTLTGGPGAQRSYIEELLPEVLEGRIEPGRVFDRTIGLDEAPEGYRGMDERTALKVLVRPWPDRPGQSLTRRRDPPCSSVRSAAPACRSVPCASGR
jgi:threonine dehydrogenase-like Zn-dependent dehydrogenase